VLVARKSPENEWLLLVKGLAMAQDMYLACSSTSSRQFMMFHFQCQEWDISELEALLYNRSAGLNSLDLSSTSLDLAGPCQAQRHTEARRKPACWTRLDRSGFRHV
jgi:hypothetical protein